MSRESKFFFATIVLPAMLMLAGGVMLMHMVHRQVHVDAKRARAAMERRMPPPPNLRTWRHDDSRLRRHRGYCLDESEVEAAERISRRRYFLCGCLLFLMPVLVMLVNGYVFFAKFRRERRDGRRKAEFVDNVSHELRTPLAGIHLTAELLADGRIQGEERRTRAARAILAEADRLNRVISALRDFSRLEKGCRQFEMEDFDLGDFASGMAEDPAFVSCAGNRLRPLRKISSATVRAEKDATFRIVLNLLENAVKYSSEEVEIEVEGRELRVLDRGDGVAKGDEDRIFERFYRGDSSLVRRFGGSGLGLSIARALARGMGADIFYSRREGGGSVFALRLAESATDKEKT